MNAASRRSRLFDDGTHLAYADLHNHSLLSDGAGDPADGFAGMRDAGLDVAALSDHAVVGMGPLSVFDPCRAFPDPSAGDKDWCRALIGLNEAGWRFTGKLADAADDPGRFAALRAFEWTNPVMGHFNVWFSSRWVDALHTVGIGLDGIGDELRALPGVGRLLDRLLDSIPGDAGMQPFYDWLAGHPQRGELGGGSDGIAGFNHPGREPGRFDSFRYDPAVADRVVSLEMFNRYDDFLFESFPRSGVSPMVSCLNAGWRVGLLGVTDEHGTDWGVPEGKGRAGLWVRRLDRAGVREALSARRFFATTLQGLRLDAAANGVRMGGAVPHRSGPVDMRLDLAGGASLRDRPLQVQVLRPGPQIPVVAEVIDVRVPGDTQPALRFAVDLDVDDGDWVVLRIADPAQRNAWPGPPGHPCNTLAVAYASPFWLDPDLSP